MNQPTTDTNKPITCKTCGKQDMTDWDGRGNCITCARDTVLSTDTIDERKSDYSFTEKLEKLFDLRISSSGSMITIYLGGEQMTVDYETFQILRDSIVALHNKDKDDFAERITPEKREFNFTSGKAIPMMAEEAYANGYNACREEITKRTKEALL